MGIVLIVQVVVWCLYCYVVLYVGVECEDVCGGGFGIGGDQVVFDGKGQYGGQYVVVIGCGIDMV